MQHWNPDPDIAEAARKPQDPWTAWLNRPPLHDVTPPPPAPRHWAGVLIAVGLFGFWTGLIALGWQLFS